MLPPTSTRLTVAFYETAPETLAASHPVIAALLQLCRRPHNGCYTVPMQDLCQAMASPPWLLVSQLQRLAAAEQLRVELTGNRAMAFHVRGGIPHVSCVSQQSTRRSSRSLRTWRHWPPR